MFQIYPSLDIDPKTYLPIPTVKLVSRDVIWQGLHVCATAVTVNENESILFDLPVGEASIRPAAYNVTRKKVVSYFQTGFNWYTEIFKTIAQTPDSSDIKLGILGNHAHGYKKIIVLNTLDAWYGHSLIYLFHLHKLIQNKPADIGIVVLIQPFLEWMIPQNGVAEVWKAGIKLSEAKKYYPVLSQKINDQLVRFDEVYLSETPILADGFDISFFTQVPVFSEERFGKPGNRITFIWREDKNRLWLKNYYLYGALKLLKWQKILLPLQKARVVWLFRKLRRLWGADVVFTIAGLGNYGKFPAWIADERTTDFDAATEKKLCHIYAESEIVAGIHGSGMILPSAHAGMTISMMPPKRWGNYAEDIIFQGEKTFDCLFRKRIVPLNMSLNELRDIFKSMRSGIEQFNQKVATANRKSL
ncbi:MAG: hypothetical protein V4722_28185 [Bacteroidota bacterium]